MKITTAQLKKIIAEEVRRTINEAPLTPTDAYAKKRDMLQSVLSKIDEAIDSLDEIQNMEDAQGLEEDTDIRSAMMDLTSIRSFVEGIHSAVDVMTPTSQDKDKSAVFNTYMSLAKGGKKVEIEDLAFFLNLPVQELQKPGFFDKTGLRVVNGVVSEMI